MELSPVGASLSPWFAISKQKKHMVQEAWPELTLKVQQLSQVCPEMTFGGLQIRFSKLTPLITDRMMVTGKNSSSSCREGNRHELSLSAHIEGLAIVREIWKLKEIISSCFLFLLPFHFWRGGSHH